MILFWKFFLYFFSLNFLMENMGVFTHPLNLTIGLLFLVALFFLYHPIPIRIKSHSLLGVGLMALGIALLPGDLITRGVCLSFFYFGLYQVLKSSKREEKELILFLTATGGYTFFLLIFKYSPFPFHLLQFLSLSFSKFVSLLIPGEVFLSNTFMGLPSLILFLIMIVSFPLLWKTRVKWVHLFSSLVGIQILYLLLHSLMNGIPQGKDQVFLQERLLLYSPLFYSILLLVPLYLYLRFFTTPSDRSGQGLASWRSGLAMTTKRSRNFLSVLSLIILIFSLGILTLIPPRKMGTGGTVVFYEEGFLNWMKPSFEEFGEESVGMFGNLPLFVEKMGFPSRMVSEISKESLEGASVLVLINLVEGISQEEMDAIWDFVGEGGSLLMLGDHTFQKGEKNWLNEVLAPVHIRFNFDSAEYFIGGWLHSFEYFHHPLTVNLGDEENDPGLVVGASLEVGYPAFPVVIGKYGFSDDANSEDSTGGYLGDLFYTPGEQLGDVILVAEEPYGKGKVFIIGDTSGFANGILVGTHPYINRVFTYLSTHLQSHANPIRFGISLLGFILFSLLFWKAGRNPTLLISSLSLALLFHHLGTLQRSRGIERPLKGGIAFVDASHNARFPMEFWRDKGVMGLHLNLMRNGYLSFSLQEFSKERLSQCDLLVLVAPSEPYSKKEIQWILEYLERGGDLILTVGWEEKGGALPFLSALGLDVQNIPLGNFDAPVHDTEEIASFVEGWALSEGEGIIAQTLSSYQDNPVIFHRKIGKGDLVLIGDSSFFVNTNLEHEDHAHTGNVNFLTWLLTLLRS